MCDKNPEGFRRYFTSRLAAFVCERYQISPSVPARSVLCSCIRYRIKVKTKTLRQTRNMKCFGWLCLCSLIALVTGPSPIHGSMINEKVLHVGVELFKETLLLQNGARFYHLQGLTPEKWYEVKISYPASIPASFSLQLKRDTSDLGLNQGRKLLNTEKIIFKTDGFLPSVEQGGMSVLVTVLPEGVVAMPGKQEREYIIFNIVCDELLLGIPHKAWYVVALGVVCLVLAFVVPSFLPPILRPKNEKRALSDHTVTKDS